MQENKNTTYTPKESKVHEQNNTIHDLELGTVVFTLKNLEAILILTKMHYPY